MTFADSVNVARRLSVRSEDDLLQENFAGDDKYSLSYCKNVASKLSSVKDLPAKCTLYKEVVSNLERRSTKSGIDPFAGMEGAGAARGARAAGSEHYAQIQRRYTKSERFNSKKK